MPDTSLDDARRLAGLELNALRYVEALPAATFEGAKIAAAGTPVYDLTGELLFYRLPVATRGGVPAYADIAAHPALGAPLLALTSGLAWDAKALLSAAEATARKLMRGLKYDEARFVAYSFPKVAVEFRAGGSEVVMLELLTWVPVPVAELKKQDPNFSRWSLLESLPADRKRVAARRYNARVKAWQSGQFGRLNPNVIAKDAVKFGPIKLFRSRELHYSGRASDHYDCYELRSQETNVWCVGASTQMLLDFYRYDYTQDRLATELGLGTKASPNGLSYANVGQVVTAIESLSSNALDATMITNPAFTDFTVEMDANRPMISFIPGHSRTVAGYIQYILAPLGATPFRGLLVYDPWPPYGSATTPPYGGVITRWENWDTQTYQFGYKAQVKLIP